MTAAHPTGEDLAPSAMDPAALRVARSLSRSFALHVAARVVEALSVGWLACALVVATIALTSREPGAQAWVAALVCGACAAASLWLEDPPRRDEHVRRVDRRLALDGALVTTAGVVHAARESTLAAALVRRVALRAPESDVTRAALPRTPLALLAGLAGAAVLFAAQDARAIEDSVPVVSAPHGRAPLEASERASSALAGAARSLRESARDGTAGSAQQSEALASFADALDSMSRSSLPAPDLARVDELERAVSAAQATATGSTAERSLTMARSALAEARRAAQERSIPAEAGVASTSVPGDGTAGARTTGADGRGSSSVPGSAGALAQSAPDGRMSAPNADPTSATGPATGAARSQGAAERGVGATRWWPPAYDAIVERWLAGEHGDASGH